jgi:peroxiredoxin
MTMHTLLLLAFLQAPAGAEALRSGCSPDDQQIAEVAPADKVNVEMAFAGEDRTCYKITLTRPGLRLTGYVLGEGLPAISAFVHRREKVSQETSVAEMRQSLPQPVVKDPAVKQVASEPLISTQFGDFSGRDPSGKAVSLSGLKGRVTVVTFWSPTNGGSVGQLTAMMPLYRQLHSSGLAAVGVSMDPNPTHINSALDDITLNWPQIPDRSGLAARYQVDPRAGKTFVLDSSRRVVFAGSVGPEMEKTVRQLLSAAETP